MNFKTRIRALFEDKFIVTIYDQGHVQRFEMSAISRITQHELKGTLINGTRIHLKRTHPFDFLVRQIY